MTKSLKFACGPSANRKRFRTLRERRFEKRREVRETMGAERFGNLVSEGKFSDIVPGYVSPTGRRRLGE
jgi:hypothetical protein